MHECLQDFSKVAYEFLYCLYGCYQVVDNDFCVLNVDCYKKIYDLHQKLNLRASLIPLQALLEDRTNNTNDHDEVEVLINKLTKYSDYVLVYMKDFLRKIDEKGYVTIDEYLRVYYPNIISLYTIILYMEAYAQDFNHLSILILHNFRNKEALGILYHSMSLKNDKREQVLAYLAEHGGILVLPVIDGKVNFAITDQTDKKVFNLHNLNKGIMEFELIGSKGQYELYYSDLTDTLNFSI